MRLDLSTFTNAELTIMLQIANRLKINKEFRTDLVIELSYRMDEKQMNNSLYGKFAAY